MIFGHYYSNDYLRHLCKTIGFNDLSIEESTYKFPLLEKVSDAESVINSTSFFDLQS